MKLREYLRLVKIASQHTVIINKQPKNRKKHKQRKKKNRGGGSN